MKRCRVKGPSLNLGGVAIRGENRGIDRWWQAVEIGEPFVDRVKVKSIVFWGYVSYRVVGISRILPLRKGRVVVLLEGLS